MAAQLSDEKIAQIMVCRACNMSHREIADEVGVSPTTVTKHVNEFQKEAERTSPEETVMRRLSPIANVVIG